MSERSQLLVNVANGNLVVHSTELAIRGTGLDLVLDRYYNSLSTADGSVGKGWTLSLGVDVQLQIGANRVTYVGPSDVQFTYTKNGSTFTAPAGADAMLVQNGDGSYTLAFQASGLRYDFSSAGVLTSEVDKDGNTITLAYNGDGTLHTITDTQGRTSTFSYTTGGHVASITDSSGRSVSYGYTITTAQNLTSVGGNAVETYTYSYNTSNQLVKILDQKSNATAITYDTNGRIATITLASGSSDPTVKGTYAFTYNTGNTVVSDPDQHSTTYYYDAQGRLTKGVDAAQNTFQWAWTADNHVSQYTDGKGQLFTYGYDANNNLTSVALPTGATARAVYGAVANFPGFYVPTSTTDAQGNQTTYGYDGNGDLTTITDQLPSQNTTQLFYNANGTVDHVIDARGNTTSYAYDANGNLTKITPPSPMGATAIVPDSLSRVKSVTDGKGQQRTYTYDTLDHAFQINYPNGIVVTYTYDTNGNVTELQDPTGATTYTIDGRNRMTKKLLPNGGFFSYSYDAASNLTSLADAATVLHQTFTVTYHYNALDLVDSLTDPSGTTSFAYDQNHRRTSTTYPDGTVLSQTYDNSGRLASITGAHSGTTLSSFSYGYANGGADTMLPQTYSETLASPSGSVANLNGTQTYDALNRLSKWLVTKQSDGSVVHDYTYQYDGDSNRTQIIADPQNSSGQIVSDPSLGLPHSNENDLSYTAPDALNQIVAYNAAGTNPGTTTYSYDAAGNQTGNDGGGNAGKALTIAYLPTNQTQSITNTSQEPVTMTWTGVGQAERVKQSWTDGGTAYATTYTYSLLGLSGRSTNAKDTPASSYFVRDPYGRLVAERNSDGTEYYYLFDGEGDVVGLEDPGTMAASYDYCPTGNEADIANGISPLTQAGLNNPFRQGSQAYEDDTKDYFGANGVISEAYNGVGTQQPGMRYGDEVRYVSYVSPYPAPGPQPTPMPTPAPAGPSQYVPGNSPYSPSPAPAPLPAPPTSTPGSGGNQPAIPPVINPSGCVSGQLSGILTAIGGALVAGSGVASGDPIAILGGIIGYGSGAAGYLSASQSPCGGH